MIKMLLLFLCLVAFDVNAEFLPIVPVQKYSIIQRPTYFSDTTANNFMIEKNAFKKDGISERSIVGIDGNFAHDFNLDLEQEVTYFGKESAIAGIIGIANSEEILGVFLTKGETEANFTPKGMKNSKNLLETDCRLSRKQCDGHTVGYFPKDYLVSAEKKYKDWYLVTDGPNIAWVNEKDLLKIPSDKLYVKEGLTFSEEDFFKFNEADDIDQKYKAIENLMKNKENVAGSAVYKPYCIDEQKASVKVIDGLVDGSSIPESMEHKKYILLNACQGYSNEYKDVKNVKMKTDKCDCYFGSVFEDYYLEELKPVAFTKVQKCQMRKYHIICMQEEDETPDGEESGRFWADDAACPKECMSWEEDFSKE